MLNGLCRWLQKPQIGPSLQQCRSLYDQSAVPRPMANRKSRSHRVTDYGYTYNLHQTGQRLPRIKDSMTEVTMKPSSKKRVDTWSTENALFGANDYIDLMGNGEVHPAQLHYHVPRWLRGFPGQHRANELIKLIHYRNLYRDKLERNAPKRWHELVNLINYLLKYHNYRKSDEMHDERELGLWKEEPDYYHDLREKRSYKDIPW